VLFDPGFGDPSSVLGPAGAGAFQPPPPIVPGRPLTVLVFPAGYAELAGADATATAVEATGPSIEQRRQAEMFLNNIKWGLGSSGRYYLYSYSDQASMVQRARRDGIIGDNQTRGLIDPTNGLVEANQAREVSQRLGLQTVLIATIEELQLNDAEHRANATVSARLITSVSGETLYSAAVTGSGVGGEGVPMSLVAEAAMRDAAVRLLPELGVQLLPAAAPAEQGRGGRQQPRSEETPSRSVAAPPAADPGLPPPAASSASPTPAGDEGAPPRTGPVQIQNSGDYARLQQPPLAGNAYGSADSAAPRRQGRRSGLRVPPWLGVAGFLTGLSFVLK